MIPVYSPLYELSQVLFYSQLWKTFRCVSTSSHLFHHCPTLLLSAQCQEDQIVLVKFSTLNIENFLYSCTPNQEFFGKN